jgi:hypothetical protein
MRGSSWVAAQLAASQEGLSSMSEWVSESFVHTVKIIKYIISMDLTCSSGWGNTSKPTKFGGEIYWENALVENRGGDGRILKRYLRQYGLWTGLKSFWNVSDGGFGLLLLTLRDLLPESGNVSPVWSSNFRDVKLLYVQCDDKSCF